MKTLFINLALFFLLITAISLHAQQINWENVMNQERHLIQVNLGWEYGLVLGAGYAYRISDKLPLILHSGFSLPAGDQILDDFKVKAGATMSLLQVDQFQFIAKAEAIYRRFGNPLVTMQNFGSELSANMGYYSKGWFLATEASFDKAIVTHFKHSASYRENVFAAKNGWYEPPTGGNFKFAIQSGLSFRNSDITLGIGRVINEDFNTEPLVPWYLELGYNYRW